MSRRDASRAVRNARAWEKARPGLMWKHYMKLGWSGARPGSKK